MQVYQNYFNTVAKKAYLDLKKLIYSLQNERTCSSCGGAFSHITCKKCGEVDKFASAKIEAIDKIVANFTYKISNLPIKSISNNKLFNLLYCIESFGIPSVNKLLKKYDYDRIVKLNLQKIISQINRNAYLDELEVSLIEALIYRNDKDVNLDTINEYFIRKAITRESNMGFIYFKKLIINFTLNKMKDHSINPCCYVVKNAEIQELSQTKLESLALAGRNKIWLSEEEIINLYEYGSIGILNDIFHENTHVRQFYDIVDEQAFSSNNILIIQERLLKKYIPNYYEENYDNIFFELEAHYNSIKELVNFLNKLQINKLQHADFEKDYQSLIAKAQSMERTINGKPTTVEDEFDKLIYKYPEFLDEYLQLNYLYKIKDGFVFRKLDEELAADYDAIKLAPEYKDEYKEVMDTFYQRILGSGRK